jgi:RNA recognition motif-containing protein
MDYVKGKHRGFAFVEFDEVDDANEAIFNLDGSDLFGRTIRVSLAQANQANKLFTSSSTAAEVPDHDGSNNTRPRSTHQEAIWKSDEWFQQHVMDGGDRSSNIQEQQLQEQDQKILQNL